MKNPSYCENNTKKPRYVSFAVEIFVNSCVLANVGEWKRHKYSKKFVKFFQAYFDRLEDFTIYRPDILMKPSFIVRRNMMHFDN